MFRDNRSANSVGLTAGDRFQYGADIAGGSAGMQLGAVAATGFVDANANCGPLAVNSNFCSGSTGYNANRLAPWQIHFTNGGGETTTVTGPSLQGAGQIAFPTSVTMSGTGLTPTISWKLPAGTAPDAFRVQIYDKLAPRLNGNADVIYTSSLDPSATSFTFPGTIGLSNAGSYAINLQLIETRGHVAFTGNSSIFSRSTSFFDFTPLTGSIPGDVALPTIGADGVYNFNVGDVGPDHITFIDPDVAVGYDYAVGAGGPNFRSVLLPNMGDGQFTLSYTDGAGPHSVALAHGQQYFFGAGGVSAFKVEGIETSVMLDPGNGTAFITGLTFESAGSFTGTMTPITVFVPVPEPQTVMLWLAGLGLFAARRASGRPGPARSLAS
jgi:hypothetical protein